MKTTSIFTFGGRHIWSLQGHLTERDAYRIALSQAIQCNDIVAQGQISYKGNVVSHHTD